MVRPPSPKNGGLYKIDFPSDCHDRRVNFASLGYNPSSMQNPSGAQLYKNIIVGDANNENRTSSATFQDDDLARHAGNDGACRRTVSIIPKKREG